MITMQRIESSDNYASSSSSSSSSLSDATKLSDSESSEEDDDQDLKDASESIIIDELSGEAYLMSIAIADLDQKVASKIVRIYHNDRKLVSAFMKFNWVNFKSF